MTPRKDSPSLLISLVFAVGIGWLAWSSWDWARAFPVLPYLFSFLAVALGGQTLSQFLSRLYLMLLRQEALTPTESKGSARWASRQDLRQAGLHDTTGLFLGCDERGHPLFFDGETHGLTLAPAGSGKTVAFTIPALCHSPLPMIVSDLKGTLAVMTKSVRENQHGQTVHCVNPAQLYLDKLGTPARYNPVHILCDHWFDPARHHDLVADAQAMAFQLCPEPSVITDNAFFRNGSRKIIVFCLLFLVILGRPFRASLSEVLRLLRNMKALMEACRTASSSLVLNGELADMATELLFRLSASDTRQVESFLEGAIQALQAFAPSGWLAESTATSDFRFRDLKEQAATVFLIADPTKMKVFAPWLGLLGWAAITELTRCQNTKPVQILLDEGTTFKIEGLSHSLTGLREFGVRVWFVIQELEEYARAYGREALETLLSQTEVKQIFGTQSLKTAELVSRMLGEQTIKAANYNLGTQASDPVTQSVNEQARRLLTPDEVRRFSDMILFVRNLSPIHAIKTGYHEVKPWSDWVQANPLFGKKLKGKPRVWLKYK